MLKSIFLLKFHFFNAHSQQLTQRFCRGILTLLFLEAQALCSFTQNIFHQIEKQEEMVKYKKKFLQSFYVLKRRYLIYQGLFDLGHMHVVVSCTNLFRKVFWNILIRKCQNYTPRTVFLALYMYLFSSNYWWQKYCTFLFLRPVANTHIPTGLEATTIQFVNEHSTIQPNWPND